MKVLSNHPRDITPSYQKLPNFVIILLMNTSDDQHQSANLLNYLGIILISVLLIAGVAWFIKTLTNRQAATIEKAGTRYMALLDQWLLNETRALTSDQRQIISQCAYLEDPDILVYREAQLRLQETHAKSIDPALEKDFLDELEKFINGNDGELLQEETTRIKAALTVCKSKHNV